MADFLIRNPDFRQATAAIFVEADFIVELGVTPLTIEPGFVEARLPVAQRHLQHSGVIHAGVQATLADHTAGAAGHTVIGAGQMVLTSTFTIHLLTPARGEELRARARVLKAGRRLVIVEADVFALKGGREELTSRATVTLAVIDRPGAPT